MHVEWQGDHKLLGDDVKKDFERELTRLGLDPSKFLVEVQREPDLPGADALHAIGYVIYITDLEHPDRDMWTLHGGHGENWIGSSPRSVVASLFMSCRESTRRTRDGPHSRRHRIVDQKDPDRLL